MGSVIPMNLNESYEFGGSVGNSTESYVNLTYRIYPKDSMTYDYYDYVDGVQRQLSIQENYENGTITALVPGMASPRSLEVYTGEPSSITIGGTTATRYTDFEAFKSCNAGWYYDAAQHLAIVRLGTSADDTTVVLSGTGEVPYEAEFAQGHNVSVNTNHAGFQGTGFVDGFSEFGDTVTFEVYAPQTGNYTVELRYSAGTEAGKRGIWVNGSRVATATLQKTANWDTWGTSSVTLALSEGKNTVTVSYDSDCFAGINLDSIRIVS